MRLLIVGGLSGQLSAAAKIAMDRGARVAFTPDADAALSALRKGQGADVLMVDVRQDIARLIRALEEERIAVPVVACGVKSDADAAVAAIRAGGPAQTCSCPFSQPSATSQAWNCRPSPNADRGRSAMPSSASSSQASTWP